MISAAQLRAVCPQIKDAATVATALTAAVDRFGIQSTAMFIAQLAHESGQFRHVREIASGQDYEGRKDLGNTQPGDGPRFRGRGYIQITGRANYAACGAALGLDLIANPELLETPENAALASAWYWSSRKLDDLGGDIIRVTKRINGGLNGIENRKTFYSKAVAAFSDQPAAVAEPQQEAPMVPFIAAALPAIVDAVPDLIRVFGKSPKAEENAKAAEKVGEIVKQVTQTDTYEGAVNAMKDPEVCSQVQDAIRAQWLEITEAGGGGIEGARKAAAELAAAPTSAYKQPVVWVSAALLPLVYFVVGTVLLKEGFSQEVQSMVIAAVISGVLGSITGYWLGTSFGSARKTDMLSSQK